MVVVTGSKPGRKPKTEKLDESTDFEHLTQNSTIDKLVIVRSDNSTKVFDKTLSKIDKSDKMPPNEKMTEPKGEKKNMEEEKMFEGLGFEPMSKNEKEENMLNHDVSNVDDGLLENHGPEMNESSDTSGKANQGIFIVF